MTVSCCPGECHSPHMWPHIRPLLLTLGALVLLAGAIVGLFFASTTTTTSPPPPSTATVPPASESIVPPPPPAPATSNATRARITSLPYNVMDDILLPVN